MEIKTTCLAPSVCLVLMYVQEVLSNLHSVLIILKLTRLFGHAVFLPTYNISKSVSRHCSRRNCKAYSYQVLFKGDVLFYVAVFLPPEDLTEGGDVEVQEVLLQLQHF